MAWNMVIVPMLGIKDVLVNNSKLGRQLILTIVILDCSQYWQYLTQGSTAVFWALQDFLRIYSV